MGKVIVVVLGLVAILAAAQYALKAAPPPPALDIERVQGAPQSEPARRLQNVRNAAARIENEAQQRADQSMPTE